MANILVVSANLKDWNKNSGGKERTANLIEALSDHKVTFLSFSWDGVGFEKQVSENIYQIQVATPDSAIRQYQKLIKGIASINYDICFSILKEELGVITKKITSLSNTSDLLIVDHMSISPLIDDKIDIPIIYNSHNAELVMAKQLYYDNNKVLSIVEQVEKSIIKKSSGFTYCSKKDYKEIEDLYGKLNNSAYIPNGTDMQKYIDPKERLRSKDIIFVGSGHPPNTVAVKKIIPIAKLNPAYNFIIIGGAGHALTGQPYPQNIKVLGQVDDVTLHRYFQKSLAFINPMESGSGTHLKMMKALSYGIPIITSLIGARGFSDSEIKNCMLVADSFDDISSSIKILENKKVYTKLSENGHKYSQNYDWNKIKSDYAKYIKSFIKTNKIKTKSIEEKKQKEKILVYSIIRNRAKHINRFYSQLKKLVVLNPEYEFYLSIYENDSEDTTKSEILTKDWSFFKGVSIICEDINTQYFTSVKDAERVENLAKARNKAIEAGGFLDKVDYVLMVEGDVIYSNNDVVQLLKFKDIEPDFDIVSSMSLRKNGTHYDWWATRTSAIYNPEKSEIEPNFENKQYGKYYSTSNGLCLYRAKPFQQGVRHHWINKVTKEFDCEMVVLCQAFHEKKYKNIYILYTSQAHHI